MALPLYTTEDELNFVKQLSERNWLRFWRYADIVMQNQRSFDKTVDMRAVKLQIIRIFQDNGMMRGWEPMPVRISVIQ